MQPTNVRVYALYRDAAGAPVVGWSADGEPMVIDPASCKLVPASHLDGFYGLHAEEVEWNVVPLPSGATCWAGFLISDDEWWWDRVVGFAGRDGSSLFAPLTVVSPEPYVEVAGEGDTPNPVELVWSDDMPVRKPSRSS